MAFGKKGAIPFKKEGLVKKILFVTSNSLATNPRLVKEIRSVVAAGHKATVISFSFNNWSRSLNEELMNGLDAKVQIIQLPGGRENRTAWLFSTVFSFLSGLLIKLGSKNQLVQSTGFFKRSWLMVWALRKQKENFDWVIAHNPGAFVPALQFVKKHGGKLGLDVEDWHPGEYADPSLASKMKAMLSKVIEKAAVITAASPLILEQSRNLTGESGTSHALVNNVFSLQQQPEFNSLPSSPLNMVWFSQTVGLNRGIQDVILAMNGINSTPVNLTLVGHCSSEVKESLVKLLTNHTHSILFLPPVNEVELIRVCSRHHIGLALETGQPFNRDICLTNKLFAYLLAGNAVIASQTTAQQGFMDSYQGIGETYPIGDHRLLAERIEQFIDSPRKLELARKQAYSLAKTQLNWETEEKVFLSLYNLNRDVGSRQDRPAELYMHNQNLPA